MLPGQRVIDEALPAAVGLDFHLDGGVLEARLHRRQQVVDQGPMVQRLEGYNTMVNQRMKASTFSSMLGYREKVAMVQRL